MTESTAGNEAAVAEAGVGVSDASPHYQHYAAATPTLVGQFKFTISKQSKETLYCIVDIHFLGFDWILLASWANETHEAHRHTPLVTEGLLVRSATTFETGVRAAFQGLAFELAGSYRAFGENETLGKSKRDTTISIAPNVTTFVYRKRYRFKATAWFVSDVEGQQTLVWSPGTAAPVTRTVEADIASAEFATLTRALSGSQSIYATPKEGVMLQSQFIAKNLGDIGAQARRVIHKILESLGVDEMD